MSKAHRRILIRPSDRGLLRFFHRGLTLNFGARASGFYWSRLAGMLSRLSSPSPPAIRPACPANICRRSDLPPIRSYRPDLGCPSLRPTPRRITRLTWAPDRPGLVGLSLWLPSTGTMETPKLIRLRSLLDSVRSGDAAPLHLLRKLTGKLLWVPMSHLNLLVNAALGFPSVCLPTPTGNFSRNPRQFWTCGLLACPMMLPSSHCPWLLHSLAMHLRTLVLTPVTLGLGALSQSPPAAPSGSVPLFLLLTSGTFFPGFLLTPPGKNALLRENCSVSLLCFGVLPS